jgi:hypothetical protein
MQGATQIEAPPGSAPAWDPAFCTRSRLYWPLRRTAEAFAAHAEWPEVAVVDEALGAAAGVHFRLQPPKPRRRRRRAPIDPGALYDARIDVEGWVPTRARSWHDFFNALVWATFPASKRAFHARQHRAISARLDGSMRALPGRRTRELDGLAILDEGGLLLLCASERAVEVAQALEVRDVELVSRVIGGGDAVALPFGHALYESLLAPRPAPIWAMVALLPCPSPLPPGNDERISLTDTRLAAAIAEPASFADPEAFRSLPLDERVLHPGD